MHYLDLILYILGNPAVLSASGESYCRLGKDIANYHTKHSWGNSPKADGTYDVDDFVSGFVRTENNVGISFNGAWAQNIDKNEMYIDFLGDKGGIRYDYCKNFVYYGDGEKGLYKRTPKFAQCNMYRAELIDFVNAIRTGNNLASRNRIQNLMPVTKLLDGIYQSSKAKKEIVFDKD